MITGVWLHGLKRYPLPATFPTAHDEQAAFLTELANGAPQVELSHVNLMIGVNSKGKSTILQALLLLRQSWRGDPLGIRCLRTHGKSVQLGEFDTICNYGGSEMVLGFRTPSVTALFHYANVTRVLEDPTGPRVRGTLRHLVVVHRGTTFCWDVESSGRLELTCPADVVGFDSAEDLLVMLFDDDGQLRLEISRYVSTRHPDTEFHLLPVGDLDPLSDAFRAVDESLRAVYGSPVFSDDLRHIGPVRTPCSRSFPIPFTSPRTVEKDGANVGPVLADARVRHSVQCSLRYMGMPYDLRFERFGNSLASVGQVVLERRRSSTDETTVDLSVQDVGYGVGQILPVLAEFHSMRFQAGEHGAGFLMVEQPELHIHPGAAANFMQTVLGWYLDRHEVVRFGAHRDVYDAESGFGGNALPLPQLLIETHSEHMLMRIQRLIRENKLSCSDVRILVVRDEASSMCDTVVQCFTPDKHGGLGLDWQDTFFDARWGEMNV